MGQRHGKQAKLTPLESKAKKSKSRRSVAEAPAAGANDDPAASATGNFVITIRMLTMNSNEANSTVAGNDRDRDAAKGNEIVDQSQVESSNQSATLQSSSSSSSWSGGRQESGSRAVCDSRKYSSATATCANCCTPVSIGSSSLADKISNMLSSRCKLGSISSSNGCQCADVAGQVASVDPPPSGTTGAGGKSKKSNWSLGKLTGRSKRDKKKDSPSCSSDDGIDLNVSSASTSSSNSDKTDSRGDETAAASSSRRTSDITTASSSSGEFLSLNGSSVVAPNPVRFPPNASISILNGTSSTSGSGATTTAAAFILPEMLTTANAGPAFIQHSNVIGHFESTPATLFGSLSNGTSGGNFILVSPFLDLARSLHPDEYSLEDYDEQARWRRALQIAEGIPAPPGAVPSSSSQQAPPQSSAIGNPIWQTLVCHPSDVASFQTLMSQLRLSNFINPDDLPRVHSTADYIHCLVPGLEKITSSCFYWGKMDRFEAEKLLEGKPEGTFLLRDSAQEEFLFSVSFRKYERSLHARIEQFNHEFSFDSHDPGVYTASTVTGLLEHYKDPSCVMFFEPMLTLPLHRNFVFSLQELARATIVSHTSYDGIDKLDVPRVMKSYLKSYHYKQRVHYKRFDEHVESS